MGAKMGSGVRSAWAKAGMRASVSLPWCAADDFLETSSQQDMKKLPAQPLVLDAFTAHVKENVLGPCAPSSRADRGMAFRAPYIWSPPSHHLVFDLKSVPSGDMWRGCPTYRAFCKAVAGPPGAEAAEVDSLEAEVKKLRLGRKRKEGCTWPPLVVCRKDDRIAEEDTLKAAEAQRQKEHQQYEEEHQEDLEVRCGDAHRRVAAALVVSLAMARIETEHWCARKSLGI
eukprot:Skav204513  [mRNA]  locus=scaffold3201:30701:35200:+ [translate_table: standard]